ncbi:TcfC E-set like domain-containing protein [Dongshaea marina]|uniref:TcfC E-set like domain-containing protein n=1 Tax=Dongshaea marina TaxID=2047966 RepID=UPI00131EE255|nr:TcfC E-set like domain-containing protein [Dongshaea marina]
MSGIDLSLVPEDFVQLLETQGSQADIYYANNKLGSSHFRLLGPKVSFDSIDPILNSMQLKPSVIRYLTPILKQGISVGKLIRTQDGQPLFKVSEFSLTTMRASLWASPHAFKTTRQDNHYLGVSSSHSLANSVSYDSLFDYTLDNSSEQSYYLNLKDQASYSNNLFTASGFVNSNQSNTDSSIGDLSLTHQLKSQQAQFGFFSGLSFNDLSGNFSSAYNGSGFIATLRNSTELRKDNEQQAASPILIFLSTPSTIQVYRDQQLISVQKFGIGNHQLDTRDFPSGIYDIKLKIYQGGRLSRVQRATVYKSFDTSAFNDAGYNYSVSAGLVNHQYGSLNNIDLPYFQGAYNTC